MGLRFAALLGVNPVGHLLGSSGTLAALPPAPAAALTGTQSFLDLISGPFHDGVPGSSARAAAMMALGAVFSLLRGGRDVHDDHRITDRSAARGLVAKEAVQR